MRIKIEEAILGAGCFWCIEAIFQDIKGVHAVESGYMGGHLDSPTYEQVCSGTTGHAEVARLSFDPDIVSFADLLMVFFEVHNPTTLNQQGADKGTQYRSVIFYKDDTQRKVAQKALKAASESGVWLDPIVTELSPAEVFYPADNYHQNYYKANPEASYCSFVIRPKVDKFKERFGDLLK